MSGICAGLGVKFPGAYSEIRDTQLHWNPALACLDNIFEFAIYTRVSVGYPPGQCASKTQN
jgi:hypothetical protein